MSASKMVKYLSVTAVVLMFCFSPAFAEGSRIVISAGSFTIDEMEMMRILATSTKGNQLMAGLMLAQMSLDDRKKMADSMADGLLFAEAAKAKRLDIDPQVAFQLKWQNMQTLTKAYLGYISQNWDLSDGAVRAYYDSHKDEFVQQSAARVRHILCGTQGEALDAALDVYKNKDFAKTAARFSRDKASSKNGGDLGWVEKGFLEEPVQEVVDNARIGSLYGPVQSQSGWHIIELLGRRDKKQLTFDEASQEVLQRLQIFYVEKELENLKVKYNLKIDEEVLKDVAGIPVPQGQQQLK